MAARTIRLENTRTSTLVLCSACGFRTLTGDRAEALRVADDHRRYRHSRMLVQARSKRRRRARGQVTA